VNASLLRAVFQHTQDHPDLLDTTTYGEKRPSGDVAADLAGRALLESGWTLTGDSTFLSASGNREVSGWQEIEDEACAALDLTRDQLWNGGDLDCLFTLPADEAVKRLRELTEEAEAVKVNA
jgi:hypothetical protein